MQGKKSKKHKISWRIGTTAWTISVFQCDHSSTRLNRRKNCVWNSFGVAFDTENEVYKKKNKIIYFFLFTTFGLLLKGTLQSLAMCKWLKRPFKRKNACIRTSLFCNLSKWYIIHVQTNKYIIYIIKTNTLLCQVIHNFRMS